MVIVEVAVRIGDSTVDLIHLDPGERFVVGSEPGTNLSVPGIGRFPLVDGDVVRVPAGVRAIAAGRRLDGALRLGDELVEIELGLAVVSIRKLVRAREPVPRPRVDLTVPAFLLVSLVAQVALWAAAEIVAPYQPPAPHRKLLPVHVGHPALPAKPPDPPKQQPPPPPQPQVHVEARRASAAETAAPQDTITDVAAAMTDLSKHWKNPEITLDGTNAAPEDYETNQYGHSRRFDPDSDPAYDTVKVTQLPIPSAGKGLGQTLPAPQLVLCDDDSCEVRGALALSTFVAELEKHRKQIQDCYVDHTDQIAGTIRLHFGVSGDGSAFSTRLHVSRDEVSGTRTAIVGTGIGTVGRCVAKLLDRVRWPATRGDTEVWLGIAFLPA